MLSEAFLKRQELRIRTRINATQGAIARKRVDADFKRQFVLPSQLTALVKICNGTYGTCACGVRISRKRLDKMPGAIRCIPCQEKFEENDRRT